MKELVGNMFDMCADAYCITTNGIVRENGTAVMGAGVALAANKKFRGCEEFLGRHISTQGHNVGVFYTFSNERFRKDIDIISFPTKYNWKLLACLPLILLSAQQLMELINVNDYKTVLLPRPGCANGGLIWEDVKLVIEPILDDRVTVVSL